MNGIPITGSRPDVQYANGVVRHAYRTLGPGTCLKRDLIVLGLAHLLYKGNATKCERELETRGLAAFWHARPENPMTLEGGNVSSA